MRNEKSINADMIDGMNCFVDLHLHLDGSLPGECIERLAFMEGMHLEKEELIDKLQVGENCRDLNQYLEKFAFPLPLLQTEEAIAEAVFSQEEELKKQGLIYAEIRFAPQFHLQKGLTQEEVVEAALRGHRKSDFEANLILCCMRMENNRAENLETVRLAAKYLGEGVCAVDLAGAEALWPNEHFAEIFEEARKQGLPFTIHAGEALGTESVDSAIVMGAKRIGHGIRCLENPDTVKRLAEKKIPLELCPTSNLHTNIFERLSDYPLAELKKAGVLFTINTDNMTVSNTRIKKEWKQLAEAFSLSQEDILKSIGLSIEASFASPEVKERLREKLNI